MDGLMLFLFIVLVGASVWETETAEIHSYYGEVCTAARCRAARCMAARCMAAWHLVDGTVCFSPSLACLFSMVYFFFLVVSRMD